MSSAETIADTSRYDVEYNHETGTFDVVVAGQNTFRLAFNGADNAEAYAAYLNDPSGPSPPPPDQKPTGSRQADKQAQPRALYATVLLWIARIPAGLLTCGVGVFSIVEMVKLAVEIIHGSHALAMFLFFLCGIGLFMLFIPPAIAFGGFVMLCQHEDAARPGRTCWRYAYGSVCIAGLALAAGFVISLILEGLLWVVTR